MRSLVLDLLDLTVVALRPLPFPPPPQDLGHLFEAVGQRHYRDRGGNHEPSVPRREIDPLYVDVAVRRWQAFTGGNGGWGKCAPPLPGEMVTMPLRIRLLSSRSMS